MTVLFCDLVDSTRLSRSLDPEDWSDTLAEFQTVVGEVVEHFDGHVAQYLGDGLMVYLGYPRAHEDDGERAVRTGLEIVNAVRALNARLEGEPDVQLRVRVGIHSGPVVIGEIGGGNRRETLAVGDSTNLAARLQEIAAPGSVVISEATLRLVQGLFQTEPLGSRELKGFSEPISAYVALRTSGVRSRLDLAGDDSLSPMVGRQQELGLLLDRWQQVLEGRGQVVAISGDAGIGKSRLARELRRRLAGTPHTWLECSGSSYAHSSALYPVIELHARALGIEPGQPVEEKLERLEASVEAAELSIAEYLPLFAELHGVPLPETLASPDLSPAARKQKLLGGLAEVLIHLGRQQPVLLLIEDLHWADASTLELIEIIVDLIPTESVFAVLTSRPEFVPSWPARGHFTPIQLNRLSRAEQTELVGKLVGDVIPRQAVEEIIERTDGVPLFVEEITRSTLESERTSGGRQVRIPESLQDSLMARLDQLGEAKELAQLCAVLGREFSYELLAAVSPMPTPELDRQLERLIESELLYCRGRPPRSSYQFRHALIQEVAYGSLLRRALRRHHERVGNALERDFPERSESQPELLAHHFGEAGRAQRALPFWIAAARRAMERSANVEAVSHIESGLELLSSLPAGPSRDRTELALRGLGGRALAATRGRGAEEVRRSFARARELCLALGNAPETFPMIFGLWLFYMSRADRKATLELAPELTKLAAKAGDPGFQLEAALARAYTSFWRGNLDDARSYAAEVLALYDPDRDAGHVLVYGQEPASAAMVIEAWSLWLLGRPRSAGEIARRALATAGQSGHSFSLAGVLWQIAILEHELGEAEACHALATRALQIGEEQHFATQAACGRTMRGAARVRRGEVAEGLAEIRAGVESFRANGQEMMVPYQLSVLVDALMRAGDHDEALVVIGEALRLARTNLDGYYEPELLRLRGQVLFQLGDSVESEAHCLQALTLARERAARTLELRAATSVARLWADRGDVSRARDLLHSVHRSFDVSEKGRDMIAASALLESLS
jgi:class 3 adenylate cyclase/tetratricopeptide (TPR) repeat protein